MSSFASSTTEMETSTVNDNLEDLLKVLHKQIKSSDGNWLKEEANKLEQENPELIKGWNNEIAKLKQDQQEQN